MREMIDFDNPSSFPKELQMWDARFEDYIRNRISLEGVTEWWQIEHQLQDLCLKESNSVVDFLNNNLETEVAVWHCTRVLNEEDFWRNGIIVSGGRGCLGEKRIRLHLSQIGVAQDMIEKIFKHIYVYWDRNIESRTESVHFQGDKKTIYNDVNASIFATNLGGEIVRWSIENIDKNLHKKEPYKRLWILGKPCIIKFKCKLSQMRERSRTDVIVEILKYFIVTKMYKYPYEFDFTGMTIGSVPSENILSIEEIENFIEIHEKYEVGFYDELKNNK